MGIQTAGQSCSFFLARLNTEVARLREIEFPGHGAGPRKWLNFIGGILSTGRLHLKISSDPATTHNDASKRIATAEALGNFSYDLLSHIAGADATQIQHQIVAPFQRWVNHLGITNTIFFRADHQPSYELGTYFPGSIALVNPISAALTDAINAISWPVLRVTVPGQAMGMLPHFAVVGHELGHAIQDDIKPDFMPFQKATDACYARIEQRLKANNIGFGTKENVRVREIIDTWVNELKADAIGHILVGPAFFFALSGFLELAGRGYGIAPSHPPSDLRRHLLVEQCKIGIPSFVDVFRTKTGLTIDETVNSPHVRSCPSADQLFIELEPIYEAVDAAICVELVPYMKDIASGIFAAARSHLDKLCPALVYKPETLEFDLSYHLEALCALVPPIEYRDSDGTNHPAPLASILNVGWAVLLTRLDHIPISTPSSGDDNIDKMERLHELLLKAVELSEASQLWKEHQ